MAAGRWKVWALADDEVGPVGSVARVPCLGLLGLLALCVTGGTGCISSQFGWDAAGVYHHAEPGYRIGYPGGPGGDEASWKSIKLDGADLAFRQASPESGHRSALMLLMSECGRGAENLWVSARQLLIGMGDRALRQAAPMAHRGSPGWMQVFDTLHDGVAVRVKTVSIRNDGCTFDWALVAPGPFRAAEEQFDVWWASFEREGAPSTLSAPSAPSAHSAGSRVEFPQHATARGAP